jgi:hypothetical protein
MGIIVELTARMDSKSEAVPSRNPATRQCDVIPFPRVKLSEMRDLWVMMKAELAENQTISDAPWCR